jgi:hypothetical protein
MVVIKRERYSVPDGVLQTRNLFWVIVSIVAVSVLFSLHHISGHDSGALIDGAMLQNFVLSSRGDNFVVYDETFEEQIKASLSYVQSIEKLERKLVFYHIPKTAGTAIEYAAGTKHIPWGSCLFNHQPKRNICQYPGEQECKGLFLRQRQELTALLF